MKRGPDGDPLADEGIIFRLLTKSNDGKISADHFLLSGDDKKQPVPRLSFWEKSLTTEEQADAHGDPARPRPFVMTLGVAEVRAVRPVPDDPNALNMDVQWEQALMKNARGQFVPSTLPGAPGHCGITGLAQPCRRSLRVELARLAAAHGLKDRRLT